MAILKVDPVFGFKIDMESADLTKNNVCEVIALRRAGRLKDAEILCGKSLELHPLDFSTLHQLSLTKFSLGFHQEAFQLIASAIKLAPDNFEQLSDLGRMLYSRDKCDAAMQCFNRALMIDSQHLPALIGRANIFLKTGRLNDALSSWESALSLDPASYTLLNCYGVTLRRVGRLDDALKILNRAFAIKRDSPQILHHIGGILTELGRLKDALESFDEALKIDKNRYEILNDRGNVLRRLGRIDEARVCYGQALLIRHDIPELYNNQGSALNQLSRFDEALSSYDAALRLRPDYIEAIVNRGIVLHNLNRRKEALVSYKRALLLNPKDALVWNNRGCTLEALGRYPQALRCFQRALSIRKNLVEAQINCGSVLAKTGRREEACAVYKKVVELVPEQPYVFGKWACETQQLCDWSDYAYFSAGVRSCVSEKNDVVPPLTFLGYCDDAAEQLKCSRRYLQDKASSAAPTMPSKLNNRSNKITIVYLSSDFRQHPVATQIAELIELHDRSRFVVLGVSLGANDGSAIRARIVAAFDRFFDVERSSDEEVAALINELGADIVVDLNGHTQLSRSGILARRPAPIQVNYLGYPGSLGADFIDYIIGDKIVTAVDQQPFFVEKIVQLPDCYLVNDSKRVASAVRTKGEVGLPEHAFVFCCFNTNWKITPPVFDVWMRLLNSVEGSVLWLKHAHCSVKRNLRNEASSRGVDPNRLIFDAKLTLEDQLARYALADLFLDTIPYNGHTTVSDALWMGLPVVTCKGGSFPSRVAASLLHAIGVPELVTETLEDYEALALRLWRHKALRASYRSKLEQNRTTHPLFDTDRFRRHIEAAYSAMVGVALRGDRPDNLFIAQVGTI